MIGRFIKSLFAWRTIKISGVYAYQQNSITGERRAIRINSGGYSPIDIDWLNAGKGDPKIDGIPVRIIFHSPNDIKYD